VKEATLKKEEIVGPVESADSELKKISLETFQSAFLYNYHRCVF
jgi:hypothetical protein